MNSICKTLTTSPGSVYPLLIFLLFYAFHGTCIEWANDSSGVQSKFGVQVAGLEWIDEGWCLKSRDGESLGRFNAVVVADKGAAKLLLGEYSSSHR